MSLIDEVSARRQLPAPEKARWIREAAGISQQRFGEELDVARNTVSRWERGDRRPRGETLVKYAALLAQLERIVS